MGRRRTPQNWKKYNKELVERGRKLGDQIKAMRRAVCEHWDEELKIMNEGKVGAQYEYPESQLMLFLVIKCALGNRPYRFLQGFGSLLFEKVPNYSAMQKRIVKMAPELIASINRRIVQAKTKGRKLTIAMDATGIQVNGKHVWIDEKFKRRRERKWVKLVLTIDTETGAILSHRLLDKNEQEGSNKNTKRELENVLRNMHGTAALKAFLGDGGFDNYDNFEMLDGLGVEPIIRVRQDSREKAHAMATKRWNAEDRKAYFTMVRNQVALAQYAWKDYVERNGYGRRSAIEGHIGGHKRFFGEAFFSKTDAAMNIEMAARALVRNMMI